MTSYANRSSSEETESYAKQGQNEVGRENNHPEDYEHTPQPFVGEEEFGDAQEDLENNEKSFGNNPILRTNSRNHELQRTPSFLERVQSKYSFFNQNLKHERMRLLIKFLLIWLLMGVMVLGIFSIYWGSMYHRNYRLRNLRMLVVIEDDSTIDNVDPIIGNTLRQILETDQAKYYGQWHIYNSSEFNQIAAKHNNEDRIGDEIQRQVHHQEYWSSIYVKPNATYNLYHAIENGESYNVTNNTISSIYETGRDFLNMNTYVTPSIQKIEKMFLAQQNNITSSIARQISNDSIFSNTNSLNLITAPMTFLYEDSRPFRDPVLVAPSQVGLIYMIIVTFFSFNFFSDVHQKVSKFNLKNHHFLFYRVTSTIMSFFVLSFFYSLVSLVMQVDMQVAFGKSGFLVYWMTSFLTMWAVGAMNEIMGMLLILVYPPLLGFWMLFWVIINISPTFTPLALSPKFFRYGYALPIHNSYEITKVIFFNTYKGQLGRNYGILVAWVVIETIALVPTVILFGKTMGKRAAQAKAAQAKAAQDN